MAALQESPEVVPTGEMPRNIIVVLDRNLVDKVSPGTRVSIMGIASLYNSAAAKKQVGGVAIRTPFMQVLYIHSVFDFLFTFGDLCQLIDFRAFFGMVRPTVGSLCRKIGIVR